MRLWREWCFCRAVLRHFRTRFLFILALLVGGGLLFRYCEPDKNHSLPRAIFFTWSLVFGEPPEEFPESPLLQSLFFVVPIFGLVVIIETIVDFSLLLRDRRRHERSWCETMAASMSNHIILVGIGKLGYRIFRLLHRLGEPVVVIERQAQCQFLEEVRREGIPILIGDARREALLEQAHVVKAKCIILATNDDLANLEIGLDARRLHPAIRVVMRMFDQNMADKIRDGFNIHLAMSQSALAAPGFATAALDPSNINSLIIEDRLVVMQRWTVRRGGPFAGKTVGQVMKEYGVNIVKRRPKGGEIQLFPVPDSELSEGDSLILQGAFETLSDLRHKSAGLH